jgi:uridine monophosphate synthetase
MVILDAKRGDIASTADAYANAVFVTLQADAVTVSPYLGRDSLTPFLTRPEQGIFVLCKTSNPGAAEFQDLTVAPGPAEPLYLRVARQAQRWRRDSGIDNVGLVVGATDPEALARTRAAAPELWFLAPGVGAQGGVLATALAAGLRADGLGLLVSVSRSISLAADPAAAAAELCGAINRERRHLQAERSTLNRRPHAPGSLAIGADDSTNQSVIEKLANALLASGCVRFGRFTLKSGEVSPIYLDLRQLASHPAALRTVAQSFRTRLDKLAFDRLAAIPYAALPIGTAIALETGWPLIYPRRETKDHGTRAAVEGDFEPNQVAVVIDDLITTGGSKFEAIAQLRDAGLQVRDVVVLIDRRRDPIDELEGGIQVHAVATLRQLLANWLRQGAITDTQFREVNAYLNTDSTASEER